MGTSRLRPAKLGEKLLEIRRRSDNSLSQMAAMLSDDAVKIRRQDVSRFERGEREPNLIILLRYARSAHIPIEVLIDDNLNL